MAGAERWPTRCFDAGVDGRDFVSRGVDASCIRLAVVPLPSWRRRRHLPARARLLRLTWQGAFSLTSITPMYDRRPPDVCV